MSRHQAQRSNKRIGLPLVAPGSRRCKRCGIALFFRCVCEAMLVWLLGMVIERFIDRLIMTVMVLVVVVAVPVTM
jgi:hypothetical protein